jgi:hypothetical protein
MPIVVSGPEQYTVPQRSVLVWIAEVLHDPES